MLPSTRRLFRPHRLCRGSAGCVAGDADGIASAAPASDPVRESSIPLLGTPVKLDLASLQDKIFARGRGGYCFEHNLILLHALKALGFEVSGLAARVLRGQPEDTITARSHMLLRIELDGRTYIADVGFGGLTHDRAAAARAGLEQQTPHETFRITRHQIISACRPMSAAAGAHSTASTCSRAYEIDYAVSQPFPVDPSETRISCPPSIAARALPDRRYALRNAGCRRIILAAAASSARSRQPPSSPTCWKASSTSSSPTGPPSKPRSGS